MRRQGLDCCSEARECSAGLTGLCRTRVLAGSFAKEVVAFQFLEGLMAWQRTRLRNSGQTFCKTFSTHAAQNVHS